MKVLLGIAYAYAWMLVITFPGVMIMANIVHASTHGMGDGSFADNLIGAVLLCGIPASFVLGFVRGGR